MLEMMEDLDFADDIAVLSHRQEYNTQKKANQFANTTEKIRLKINNTKTKVIMQNLKNPSVRRHKYRRGPRLWYIGSKITIDGDLMADVQARISKATGAKATLWNVWRSTKISTSIKNRISRAVCLGSSNMAI